MSIPRILKNTEPLYIFDVVESILFLATPTLRQKHYAKNTMQIKNLVKSTH